MYHLIFVMSSASFLWCRLLL